MLIEADQCSPSQLYHLMVQTIIPRPIAWILSLNRDGSPNLAPFSYFNGLCSDPPLLMVSVGRKKDGQKKDTWLNIEERGVFVVHIAGVDRAQDVEKTAEPLDYGDSEVTLLGLETERVPGWPLPRLKGVPAALLCRLHRILEVGRKPQALILGEITGLWIDDEIAVKQETHFTIDMKKMNPLARAGHDTYTGAAWL